MNENDYLEKVKLRLEAVLKIHEKNLRYIESLGIDAEVLRDYRRVANYLKTLSIDEISSIFGPVLSKKKPAKTFGLNISDEEIERMDGEIIRKFLSSPDVPRSFLERIAAKRFSITTGALSTLRSHDALREKIQNSLSHENAHAAISRVLSKNDDTADQKKLDFKNPLVTGENKKS